ncbi:MAG: bifunctional precorrin-2 dehydrogenase/sirohydrochlorin ferrochelatase [Thermacetogeniaceae bacterium]
MKSDDLYPIYLKLEGKKCLVVGGGAVAQRKIHGLRECGAAVTVVSPELTPSLQETAIGGDFCYNRRGFRAGDLDGQQIVVAATGDFELNAQIARLCLRRSIPVNVVDNPGLSTFYVPAVIRRGPLCISISTGGSSPLLARRIREDLEGELGPGFAEIATLLGEMRQRIQDRLTDEEERRRFWDQIVTPELIALLKSGATETARKQVKAACISLLSE